MPNSAGCSDKGKRGLLVVISGPSGAGKTSICRALIARLPDVVWSVSATTRPMRPGDQAGTGYEFITRDEFEDRRAAGAFLESAEYVGHLYGTPRAPVEQALSRGRNVVLEIDVQGGIQIAEKVPESVRVFVLPPDMDSLRARLEGRGSEVEAQLKKRLARAEGEIATAHDSGCYDHFVVNDELEPTIEKVLDIVAREQAHV